MWTRQYNGGAWSVWHKFVSAKELTDGTIVPKKATNADKAKTADVANAIKLQDYVTSIAINFNETTQRTEGAIGSLKNESGLFLMVLGTTSAVFYLQSGTDISVFFLGTLTVTINKTASKIFIEGNTGLIESTAYFYKITQ
jgi:hypothetical protein